MKDSMNRRTTIVVCALLAAFMAVSAFGQSARLQFNLDHLASKAAESVNVTIEKDLLTLAMKFFSDKDPDQAKIKKLLGDLQGVYVRSFEFDKEGQYSMAEVDAIRKQLNVPGWARVVEVRERGGDNVDVYLRQEAGKIMGLAVIATEPKELTVVNIVGPISIEDFGNLGGIAGIPRIRLPRKADLVGERERDRAKKKENENDEQ